ncbi:hypothetical protein VTO73DRAFT_14498 [Trametes versicolor]
MSHTAQSAESRNSTHLASMRQEELDSNLARRRAIYLRQRPQLAMFWHGARFRSAAVAAHPHANTSDVLSASRLRASTVYNRHAFQSGGQVCLAKSVSNIPVLRSITVKRRVVRLWSFPRVSRSRPQASSPRDRRALGPLAGHDAKEYQPLPSPLKHRSGCLHDITAF